MMSRSLLEHFEPSHWGGLFFMLSFACFCMVLFSFSVVWESEGQWSFFVQSFLSLVKRGFAEMKSEDINSEMMGILFIGILGLNLSPLCPMCPSLTVYMTLSLCIALPMCLASGISKWYNQPVVLVSAMTGRSGNVVLSGMVFLSMVASAFLRPVSLCIRISINALVGHLLLMVASWFSALFYVPGALSSLGGTVFLSAVWCLEVAVAVIQSGIFVYLLSSWVQELDGVESSGENVEGWAYRMAHSRRVLSM